MGRIALAAVFLIALIAGFVVLYPTGLGQRLLVPLFYRRRRPTPAGRRLNRAWSWLVANGFTPDRWPGRPVIGPATVETVGRTSGRPCSNMVTWVEHEGDRYLVSMLGERSDWVRNSRAAGGIAVIRRGGRRPVRLLEVPVSERAPIIRAWYRRTWQSTLPHLRLDPKADVAAFEGIAPSHPVFRIIFEGT